MLFVCVCVLLGLELRAYTLRHSNSLFFFFFFFSPLAKDFFEIGSPQTFCAGRLQTVILLISAS
jgi:hypothetical protein